MHDYIALKSARQIIQVVWSTFSTILFWIIQILFYFKYATFRQKRNFYHIPEGFFFNLQISQYYLVPWNLFKGKWFELNILNFIVPLLMFSMINLSIFNALPKSQSQILNIELYARYRVWNSLICKQSSLLFTYIMFYWYNFQSNVAFLYWLYM